LIILPTLLGFTTKSFASLKLKSKTCLTPTKQEAESMRKIFSLKLVGIPLILIAIQIITDSPTRLSQIFRQNMPHGSHQRATLHFAGITKRYVLLPPQLCNEFANTKPQISQESTSTEAAT
jgi:hypothetical protein